MSSSNSLTPPHCFRFFHWLSVAAHIRFKTPFSFKAKNGPVPTYLELYQFQGSSMAWLDWSGLDWTFFCPGILNLQWNEPSLAVWTMSVIKQRLKNYLKWHFYWNNLLCVFFSCCNILAWWPKSSQLPFGIFWETSLHCSSFVC